MQEYWQTARLFITMAYNKRKQFSIGQHAMPVTMQYAHLFFNSFKDHKYKP